jgi:hypothetical protein
MPMTRAEHLAWCKQRALEYLPHDISGAWGSMASDLGKHPDTQPSQELVALGMITETTPAGAKRFIEGFN